jgi:DNA-directed RNA polymerase specialized sigma24 family protein
MLPSGASDSRRTSSRFRYAYIRLRSKANGEDIVAQVFIEAFRGIHRYSYAGKPLLVWLYRNAHNLSSRNRRPGRELDYVAGEEGIALDQGLEVQIANLGLKRAIDALAEVQRDVIECAISSRCRRRKPPV